MSKLTTASNVTIIPARNTMSAFTPTSNALVRVAAYCRVSTNEDEQLNSYATQVSYYTDYINSNPDWELVGIFADEGISGTGTAKRTQFKKMLRLCKQKRIDLILCKSISRFARNTVDCLETVRKLKKLGINVKFEKENIDTMSASSEFTISLYASFAQAESESISKNITWGIEKSFREGKVRYKLDQTLGYRMGEDGQPVIVEEEAVHIRTIFKMFADGYSMREIAEHMTELAVMRRNGSTVWNRYHVGNILHNENYAGDATMQKSYTVDCLTHKRVKNTGQKAKYHMQDCHDAIIDRETWDRVRLELAKHSMDALQRKDGRHRENYRTKYCFSQLLKCGCCGGTYKRTIWKFGDQPVGVWRCGIRLDYGNQRCKQSPSIHEDNLHQAIISAINAAIRNAADLTETVEHCIVRKHAEILKLREEYDDVTAQLREIESRREDILSLISGNSFDRFRDELKALNAAEAEYAEKLTDLERRQNDLQLSIHQTYAAREQFEAMQQLAAFDELVVRRLVEEIIVLSKTKIRVVFHGGLEYVCDVEKGRRKI